MKSEEVTQFKQWLSDNNVEEVETLVSDFAGISRGKKMPAEKFVKALGTDVLRLPDSILGMTVDCQFILNAYITDLEIDVFLEPDLSTVGIVPWNDSQTAYVICDLKREDGSYLNTSPRQILQKVLGLYADKGWKPVVAPEFEFILANVDQDAGGVSGAPRPAVGASGRACDDKGCLSIDGLDDFAPLFDDVKRYCATMGLPTDAMVQEAGAGQFEFNVAHGDPIAMADATFQFKRLLKRAAYQHGICASFMARPYPDDFGNAMHIHQSVVDIDTGENVFAGKDKDFSDLFLSHVAGFQKYAAAAILFFAPYENSYLRIGASMSSPANTHWGLENRSVGLRVPASKTAGRRVENRFAGADTNPYLAIAASLLCGYLGMVEGLKPTDPVTGSAYGLESNLLPQNIHAGLTALDDCAVFRELLSDEFIQTYLDVKKAEIGARANILSPWDTKFLLANV